MPKIGFDTDIYSNDGTTWYGGDDMLDMGFTITVQSNKLVGQFQASGNGATLDNGNLILPFNILGLTQTINKQTPDDGMAVGDSITTYNGQMSGSVALYVVPAPESDITPKAVSLDNLQTFKGKCDETYAPMSRALPAPAGTTDAGKVPTVNSAGNGYELQTPSGGGKQLYQHNLRVHNDDYSIVLTFTIINDTNVEMSYSDIVQFLETITGTYGSYTYPCSGICQGMPTGTAPVTGIDCGLSTGNIIYHFVKDNSQFADSLLSNHANIIDVIIPL